MNIAISQKHAVISRTRPHHKTLALAEGSGAASQESGNWPAGAVGIGLRVGCGPAAGAALRAQDRMRPDGIRRTDGFAKKEEDETRDPNAASRDKRLNMLEKELCCLFGGSDRSVSDIKSRSIRIGALAWEALISGRLEELSRDSTMCLASTACDTAYALLSMPFVINKLGTDAIAQIAASGNYQHRTGIACNPLAHTLGRDFIEGLASSKNHITRSAVAENKACRLMLSQASRVRLAMDEEPLVRLKYAATVCREDRLSRGIVAGFFADEFIVAREAYGNIYAILVAGDMMPGFFKGIDARIATIMRTIEEISPEHGDAPDEGVSIDFTGADLAGADLDSDGSDASIRYRRMYYLKMAMMGQEIMKNKAMRAINITGEHEVDQDKRDILRRLKRICIADIHESPAGEEDYDNF